MLLISLPKAAGLALAASLLSAAPSYASGGYSCLGGGALFEMGTGRLPVLQVLGAYAEAGGKRYSTGPDRGDGVPIVVGQAFAEDDSVMVDFVDPNFETILVSLRMTFDGDEEWPFAGTLVIDGKRYSVSCDGD